MTFPFSPFERYFDADGKPTGIGQQLFLRLNQLFAAQDASLALTNTTLVATNASLVGTQGDVATEKVSTTSRFATVNADLATKAPLNGPVFTAPPALPSYTVAGVPSAALYPRGLIWVSNESGGAQGAQSDGTNWLRFSDRAIIS